MNVRAIEQFLSTDFTSEDAFCESFDFPSLQNSIHDDISFNDLEPLTEKIVQLGVYKPSPDDAPDLRKLAAHCEACASGADPSDGPSICPIVAAATSWQLLRALQSMQKTPAAVAAAAILAVTACSRSLACPSFAQLAPAAALCSIVAEVAGGTGQWPGAAAATAGAVGVFARCSCRHGAAAVYALAPLWPTPVRAAAALDAAAADIADDDAAALVVVLAACPQADVLAASGHVGRAAAQLVAPFVAAALAGAPPTGATVRAAAVWAGNSDADLVARARVTLHLLATPRTSALGAQAAADIFAQTPPPAALDQDSLSALVALCPGPGSPPVASTFTTAAAALTYFGPSLSAAHAAAGASPAGAATAAAVATVYAGPVITAMRCVTLAGAGVAVGAASTLLQISGLEPPWQSVFGPGGAAAAPTAPLASILANRLRVAVASAAPAGTSPPARQLAREWLRVAAAGGAQVGAWAVRSARPPESPTDTAALAEAAGRLAAAAARPLTDVSSDMRWSAAAAHAASALYSSVVAPDGAAAAPAAGRWLQAAAEGAGDSYWTVAMAHLYCALRPSTASAARMGRWLVARGCGAAAAAATARLTRLEAAGLLTVSATGDLDASGLAGAARLAVALGSIAQVAVAEEAVPKVVAAANADEDYMADADRAAARTVAVAKVAATAAASGPASALVTAARLLVPPSDHSIAQLELLTNATLPTSLLPASVAAALLPSQTACAQEAWACAVCSDGAGAIGQDAQAALVEALADSRLPPTPLSMAAAVICGGGECVRRVRKRFPVPISQIVGAAPFAQDLIIEALAD